MSGGVSSECQGVLGGCHGWLGCMSGLVVWQVWPAYLWVSGMQWAPGAGGHCTKFSTRGRNVYELLQKKKNIPLANFYSQYYHYQEISFLPGGRKENSADGQLIFICS